MSKYKTLDFDKVIFDKEKMPMDATLKESSPIDWPEEVKTGRKKIKIKNIEKDYENKCAKLETSSS